MGLSSFHVSLKLPRLLTCLLKNLGKLLCLKACQSSDLNVEHENSPIPSSLEYSMTGHDLSPTDFVEGEVPVDCLRRGKIWNHLEMSIADTHLKGWVRYLLRQQT